MRAPLGLMASLILCASGPNAYALDIPCRPVEPGVIVLDGLLGDWREEKPVRLRDARQVTQGRDAWSGPDDLSLDIYCNHTRKHLYLALRVRDDYVVRTPQKRGDDHLTVTLGGKTLVVHAGDLQRIRGSVTWGKKPARDVSMAEALQKDGYSVELRIPLASLSHRPGAPTLAATISAHDSDSKAKQRIESVISTGPSRITFAQAGADLAAFLKDKGYKATDVRWRRNADVVGDKRVEQVLLAGRTIAVIGEGVPGGGGYLYLDLGVRSASDVKRVELVDLNGDRKVEILVRYLERGSGGSREVLAVFRFDSSDKFVRTFMHEIGKYQGGNQITNQVSYKRRKKKPHGVDIVIEKPAARGFTEQTYRESPATDVYPILLPWGKEKRRAFRFDGDEHQQQ